METRAPHALIGLFVLVVIGAIFGFVYWLHNTGGLAKRDAYEIRFQNSVAGLLTGAAVLFNGIKVGEVTELRLNPQDPQQVTAMIAVAANTPVRADTRVDLEFQGLTGVPVIALSGGSKPFPGGAPPVLLADPTAGQSMTQAAREALRKVDTVLTENAEPLRNTIANINTFAAALARNADKVDGILAGIERLTGGGPGAAPPTYYDLTAPRDVPQADKPLPAQLSIREPTGVLMYDTQRILVLPSGAEDASFATARWTDSLPKLLQARILQTFENAGLLRSVARASIDDPGRLQLQIDIRNFQLTLKPDPVAEVEFAARLVGEGGEILAARIFRAEAPATGKDAAAASAALNQAFVRTVKELVAWTVESI